MQSGDAIGGMVWLEASTLKVCEHHFSDVGVVLNQQDTALSFGGYRHRWSAQRLE
jgi:hypothetical protein